MEGMQTAQDPKLDKVFIDIHENQLHIQIQLDGQPEQKLQINYDPQQDPMRKFVVESLNALSGLFPQLLEAPQLNWESSQKLSEREDFRSCVLKLKAVCENTQKLWGQVRDLKKDFEKAEAQLFLVTDNHPTTRRIYEQFKKLSPKPVFIRNYASGFDPKLRKFNEHQSEDSLEFVRFLAENQISKVICNSNLYLTHLMNFNIHLLPVLDLLGVEWIALDFDVADGSFYSEKKLFSWSNFRRYSITPHIQDDWHQLYGIKNVRYLPAAYVLKEPPAPKKLNTTPTIIVRSHLRLQLILSQLHTLLYSLERTSETDCVRDFILWYHSMRQVVLQDPYLSTSQKDLRNTYLYRVYLAGMSFLKLESLSWLAPKYQLEVYGDEHWNKILPNEYQGKYLAQQEAVQLNQDRDCLFLLVNDNFSYLENNPAHHQCIEDGFHFLCWPSVVQSQEFEGFKDLEYRNAQELNQKIDMIQQLSERHSLRESKKELFELGKESLAAVSSDLAGEPNLQDSRFAQLYRQQHQAFKAYLEQYVQQKINDYIEQYSYLFQRQSTQDLTQTSRFSSKPYFKALIREMQNLQKQ